MLGQPVQRDGANAFEPWGVPTDPYECDHDRVIMDCLQRGLHPRAYEAGCGTGRLTEQLAGSCQRLIARDIAPSAVARARIRCSHLNHVSVRCADMMEHLPEGPLDLFILREIGHPMSAAEVLWISLKLSERLAPGGELVALHGMARRGSSPLAGETIHNLLCASLPLERLKANRGAGYRLDSWTNN